MIENNEIEQVIAAADRRLSAPARCGCGGEYAGHSSCEDRALIERLVALLRRSRAVPPAERLLRAAFSAGFDWCSSGTDTDGGYNGAPVEDGFDRWMAEASALPWGEPVESSAVPDSGLCCMADHAADHATPWTCKCTCHGTEAFTRE